MSHPRGTMPPESDLPSNRVKTTGRARSRPAFVLARLSRAAEGRGGSLERRQLPAAGCRSLVLRGVLHLPAPAPRGHGRRLLPGSRSREPGKAPRLGRKRHVAPSSGRSSTRPSRTCRAHETARGVGRGHRRDHSLRRSKRGLLRARDDAQSDLAGEDRVERALGLGRRPREGESPRLCRRRGDRDCAARVPRAQRRALLDRSHRRGCRSGHADPCDDLAGRRSRRVDWLPDARPRGDVPDDPASDRPVARRLRRRAAHGDPLHGVEAAPRLVPSVTSGAMPRTARSAGSSACSPGSTSRACSSSTARSFTRLYAERYGSLAGSGNAPAVKDASRVAVVQEEPARASAL